MADAGAAGANVAERERDVGGRHGAIAAFLLRYGIVLALLALVAFFAWRSPVFLTDDNLLQVLLQASVNTIVALGMTFVIITAGIDLSVGSTAALAGMVAATAMKTGLLGLVLPWPVAVLVGLLVGLLVGATNGLLITWLRITPFIVTLGTLSVVRGLTLIFSEGRPVFGFPEGFNAIAGRVGPVPVPVLIAAVLTLVVWFVLRYTRLGEYTYAIGGNEEATRLAGVPVTRYKVAVYTLGGALAAVAGIVLTARLRTAEPNAASGYELDAIAATVMGGTSLFGGEGGVVGTIVGALIIATLRNGLNLLNVQAYYQQLAIGLVIILAVALDRFRQ
ncbi:MAG: Ribose ABC transport system, permease protein RbsC [uncultured Thermomicrobiales bacterium]|uniref:Ribose ABC transport system, permease protein RbsC n=1 Tax=uncultured Thermomicrobiales bacterium TaxID=1645740 RepID=A0A6J4UX15_9BACT|nr:MAG: Ribose ABC transport system, permease protein RbsC [uncultured Thermomicrobiales bacterium]